MALILQRNHGPKPPSKPTDAITYSQPTPSEAKVNVDYAVPDDQPLKIEITGRDIAGYIQRVGVDQNKAVAAPNNVNLAGWFVDSVLPGRKGLSIIDGHVDGVSQPGIFHNLTKVVSGDSVTVTMGDKTRLQYQVFAARSVAVDEASKYLYDQDPSISSQLNIITCTGRYDAVKKSYDKRVIVSAKLLP